MKYIEFVAIGLLSLFYILTSQYSNERETYLLKIAKALSKIQICCLQRNPPFIALIINIINFIR